MDCSMPGFPFLPYLPEFAQTHVHWVSDLILCCPLLLLLSVFPVSEFFPELAVHISDQKYWSFSISPSNEYSGLISFRIDWIDLLAVQWTLKSLLQYHSSKPSIFWPLAFFMFQLSHSYMTTEKTITLTVQTFVGISAFYIELQRPCVH